MYGSRRIKLWDVSSLLIKLGVVQLLGCVIFEPV